MNSKNSMRLMKMKQMIKRFTAVTMLLLFVLSIVPLAFAQNTESDTSVSVRVSVDSDSDDEHMDETSDSDDDEMEVDDSDDEDSDADSKERMRTREDIRIKNGEIRTKIEQRIRTASGDEKFELRSREEIRERIADTKIRVEVARERYEQAKERYQEARLRFQENKERVSDLHDAVRACREDSESEDCEDKRADLRVGVSMHLVNTIRVMEESLERLIDRIESSTQIDDEAKVDAIASLEEMEAELTAKRLEVEAMAETATNEELKASIKELRELWQETRKGQRRIIASLTNSQLENLIARYDGFVAEMDVKITAAADAGLDTSELEELKAEYTTQVGEIESDYAALKDSWETAKEDEDSLERWKNAQEDLKEKMREARDTLREFLRTYNSLGLESNVEADVETDEVSAEAVVGADAIVNG